VRILRVAFLDGGEKKGNYYRALFLGKYLAEQGHKVLLIALSGEPTYEMRRELASGVEVLLVPFLTTSGRFLVSASAVGWLLIGTLMNCILEITSDVDILHSFGVASPQNAAPTVLSQIARSLHFHRKKIFVDWGDWWGRGGLFTMYSGNRWMQPLDPVVTFLEEKVAASADAVIATNEILRQRALSAGVKPQNLFLIPNGANVDFIRPLDIYDSRRKLGLPEKNIIYSHFGRFYDLETIKSLILAHEKVIEECPSASLLLLGLPTDQLDFVKSLSVTRNVIYVDEQPYHEYPTYLGASDILLLPLEDHIANRARWPLRLSDYLSSGRPIIATRLPVIERALQKCGFLAAPGDPEDFACKILEAIGDPHLRQEMGKRARELAEREYSWQLLAKQLETIYSRYLQ